VQNISQYDSGERCGPWASCFVLFRASSRVFHAFFIPQEHDRIHSQLFMELETPRHKLQW
jgi:hypothetical protein